MRRFREEGYPTLAALRPTFPFAIVPEAEVSELFEILRGIATCVLGEVFLLDQAGVIANRLGLPEGNLVPGDHSLTFLDQGSGWQKRIYPRELEYARSMARRASLPFFERSMSAIRFLEESWDFACNQLASDVDIPAVGCYDHLLP
jgi:hypothetical protein